MNHSELWVMHVIFKTFARKNDLQQSLKANADEMHF